MAKKILVVGGVAGGASAAARLRRLDEKANIVLFEKGPHISFANCGLPYHIGDEIKEREALLLHTPDTFKARLDVDVRINSMVSSINAKENKVTVTKSNGETYEESYDELILSPGAKPMRPPIPGIDNKNIFTLRNINDMDKIKDYIKSNSIKSAVVVGGGFIGVEMAENLHSLNVETSLIEAAPHVLTPFDMDIVPMIEDEIKSRGINLYVNNPVSSFAGEENKLNVTLKNGEKIETQMVILSIGVTPDTAFIKNSGIELGPKGHIVVDDHLRTNFSNIYAVGDAIEVKDYVDESKTAIPLAGPANKQGRMAADNIYGANKKYTGSLGSSIIKVFDLTCARTGNTEFALKKKGIEYHKTLLYPQSHASYYPGAMPMALKVLFGKEGKILGAQAVGYEGVAKRIDVIATSMKFKGTVHDLTELELCYAPPFSSAKDPVNMAGYVGENILKGKTDIIAPEEIDNIPDSAVLLDVRTDLERENGYLKDSIHIPVDSLRENLDKLPKDKEIWVYCQIGLRGYIAERILKQNGFKVKNITGGYKFYRGANIVKAGEPTEMPKNINTPKVEAATDKLDVKATTELDACGLCCPGPLLRTKEAMDELNNGEKLRIKSSDPGFYEDIKAWCHRTENNLVNLVKEKGIITAEIIKGMDSDSVACDSTQAVGPVRDNKTMVVFSGDLDKAIASFIIANGAAAMGKKVTMFFTFWGINVLRNPEKVKVDKSFIEKMFGFMMPRGTDKLKLSNMNMMGMGGAMIKGIMKKHNVASLPELIASAQKNGVEIVACQMSMDLLGLKLEELIPGVKVGGVGYYLGEAEDSNVNLFI
ncbi:FAD-dependent oxidoreductase [Oceanirhabdus sp. W0125-5]|uniref:FAD-dependent oxidoreductase n=1 Tax=Oceanirhabdus sp. W0125-5 TaxID=2999116 RepID=UPI0022F30944|nr:FAD-dependent oxidoreductase [Oceanirhabdus sp. W0125-5]WBW96103.1 FAD-dependent oxidoreductase [Oceanirhabdus sp. W0125-5]